MPRRLLVVEDESLFALMIEDMAEESGHTVVAKATNVREARTKMKACEFDVALLDVNFAGEFSYSLAEMQKARTSHSCS